MDKDSHRRKVFFDVQHGLPRQGPGSDGETIRHCLPAQPPVTLDWLYQCSDEEVRAFTARFDYFRLVLEAREVPADELLATSLRTAGEMSASATHASAACRSRPSAISTS